MVGLRIKSLKWSSYSLAASKTLRGRKEKIAKNRISKALRVKL